MSDIVSTAVRSRMMSGIRGKDTKPELVVRRYLHRRGFRFRLHAKLPGKPDLVLSKYRTVIFVHGCFWHRHHGCRFCTIPKGNAEFWADKFKANVERDKRVVQQLEELRWRVLTVWECSTSESELEKLAATIRSTRGQEKSDGGAW